MGREQSARRGICLPRGKSALGNCQGMQTPAMLGSQTPLDPSVLMDDLNPMSLVMLQYQWIMLDGQQKTMTPMELKQRLEGICCSREDQEVNQRGQNLWQTGMRIHLQKTTTVTLTELLGTKQLLKSSRRWRMHI